MTKKKKGRFEQPRRNSDAELDAAFAQVTAAANGETVYQDEAAEPAKPRASKPKAAASATAGQKKIMAICAVVVTLVFIVAIGVGIFWYLDYTEDDGLIFPNVYAAGINLGGMTPQEAEDAITRAIADTYSKENLTVTIPDATTLVFSPSDTRVRLDTQAAVEAIYAYGRQGSPWVQAKARAAAAQTSYEMDLTEYLILDTDYIRDVLEQVADNARSELTQHQITLTGEMPELNREYEEAAADETVEHMTMTIVLGTPHRSLDTDELYDTILNAYMTNDFSPIHAQYEVVEPDALDLEKLFQDHCTEPVDATLDLDTYDITQEVLGYGFDIEELTGLLAELLPGETLEYTFRYLSPTVTKASLEANLFQDTLASVDTYHTNIPNRTNNLIKACEAIDGTILRPGETFSFNNIVGERTAEKGYKAAAVYSGGKTVSELGGGVCQVASTIYYAAMLADLEIVDRTEHMYWVDYVPPGMDATIYWGYLDFKFKNNTNYPIRVDASVSGGQVHIDLIGTDEKDYYIKMTYETIDGPHYGETKYEVYAPENDEGYYDGEVLQSAYTGYTIRTYRCKYSKATDELISSQWEATSEFAKRDALVVIIGDPTAPTDEDGRPIETTTEPTEPPTEAPTQAPTDAPTEPPTDAPTDAPTEAPQETEEPDINDSLTDLFP